MRFDTLTPFESSWVFEEIDWQSVAVSCVAYPAQLVLIPVLSFEWSWIIYGSIKQREGGQQMSVNIYKASMSNHASTVLLVATKWRRP